MASILANLRLVDLGSATASLSPASGQRGLAEGRLGEASVVLTKVLGRPVRAELAADDIEITGDADAGSAGPPDRDEIPDEHPLVDAVRAAFDAEIVDKVARPRGPGATPSESSGDGGT